MRCLAALIPATVVGLLAAGFLAWPFGLSWSGIKIFAAAYSVFSIVVFLSLIGMVTYVYPKQSDDEEDLLLPCKTPLTLD